MDSRHSFSPPKPASIPKKSVLTKTSNADNTKSPDSDNVSSTKSLQPSQSMESERNPIHESHSSTSSSTSRDRPVGSMTKSPRTTAMTPRSGRSSKHSEAVRLKHAADKLPRGVSHRILLVASNYST